MFTTTVAEASKQYYREMVYNTVWFKNRNVCRTTPFIGNQHSNWNINVALTVDVEVFR